MSFVRFDIGKDAATAEGVAIVVEVATCSACVFKHLFVALAEQLGLAGSYFGVLFHIMKERAEPTFGHFNVGVE